MASSPIVPHDFWKSPNSTCHVSTTSYSHSTGTLTIDLSSFGLHLWRFTFCHYILAKEGIVHRNRLYFLQWTVNRISCYAFAYLLIEEGNPWLALYLGYWCQCKNMAEITKNKSTCVTSSTVLATGGSDDFKGGRRHLWKQRMTGPDNSYIKLT